LRSLRLLFSIVLCMSLTALAQTAQPANPPARTDVYHVHFAKAAPGKAMQMADFLKTPDPKAPMPGHFLLLMHQEGDDWDYALIEHLGTKATVEAAGTPMPPNVRDIYDWHNDTFVNGPAWPVFSKAMGLDQPNQYVDSVYVVSTYRSVPGRRDDLEKFLNGSPEPNSAGSILLQHLEGGPWNFLTVERFNSWQDFAKNDSDSVAQTRKGSGQWFQLRDNAAFHRDTLTTRVAP
jgi:hypothetical protein